MTQQRRPPGKDAMSTQESLRTKAGVLTVPATLAHLLDVLDHHPRGADAAQYRAVATSLAHELTRLDQDTLALLLKSSPAATELYENLHRSDLDAAMQAELQAKEALGRAARKPSRAAGA
jgi:hypothetical protein